MSTSKQLTADRISQLVQKFNKPNRLTEYWQLTNPNRYLTLAGSPRYVEKNYPNAQGVDRFVYWPDYKVAGTIKDIVNAFLNAGINQVQVGTLYSWSNGQIGCQPRMVPLTPEIVAECAFDPLNPAHTELLMTLMNMDLRYVLNNLQQAQQYRQEQQQYRQQIGSELSILPPQGAFPGGPEYLEAQQGIGGRYGMRM